MKYCMECGRPLKPTIIDGQQRLACQSCDFVFWNNPTPVAAAVLTFDGKVVLVRPNYLPAGRWGLPAGFVEDGETAEQAILREIKEETNLDATLGKMIGSYNVPRPNRTLLFIAFEARAVGGDPKPNSEIAEVSTFPPVEAKRIMAGTTAGKAIEDWLNGSTGA